MDDVDDDFRERHLRAADFLGAFAVMETGAGFLMVQNRRRIGGRDVMTWDLPGGQVEPGEELRGALARELSEELGVRPAVEPTFLFLQEGRRVLSPSRSFVWRSFFFRVDRWDGEPSAGAEVLDCRFVRREEMPGLLSAPYHDSFLRWLVDGGVFFSSIWAD